jgi:hypothetical protein
MWRKACPAAVLFCAASGILLGQTQDLARIIPDLYGPNGLLLASQTHAAHFESSFRQSFTPMNSAVGSQLALLPFASPASGFVYTFDTAAGVYSRSSQTLGPIISERAETIGRRRLFVGISYQYFNFSSIDGIDLKDVPVVFRHDVQTGSEREKDYITTQNSVGLDINQFTAVGTFGLTDGLDISVAIPIVNVHLSAVSDARIQRIAPPDPVTGEQAHFFDATAPDTSTRHVYASTGNATGIGDVTFRIKGTVFKGENGAVALAADVRTPTGDESNFLGTGAVGFKPFVIASYRAGRIAPHGNAGFQWNGSSLLAGDISKGEKARLPRQFIYAAGADIGATKNLTVVFDLLGARVFNGPRVTASTYPDAIGRSIPDVTFGRESFNIIDGSAGLKLSIARTLLVTANVIFKLNDSGLRAKVIPLVGLSYTF